MNKHTMIMHHLAQGALVNVVGIASPSMVGGAMCAYSRSAAFSDGVQFTLKSDPKRRCWTTGNFPNTSVHHILYMPPQILLHEAAPLMSYNIGLVS